MASKRIEQKGVTSVLPRSQTHPTKSAYCTKVSSYFWAACSARFSFTLLFNPGPFELHPVTLKLLCHHFFAVVPRDPFLSLLQGAVVPALPVFARPFHTFYFSKPKPNPSEILFYIYRQATPSRQGLPAPGEGAGSGCSAVAAVTAAAHRASTRAFGDCRSPSDSREQNICPSRPCYGASHPIWTRGCSHRMHNRMGAAVVSLGATLSLHTALLPPLAAKIVCCRELGGAARQPSDPRGAAGHRRALRSRDGWRVTASSAPLTCWCRRAELLFSLLCSI